MAAAVSLSDAGTTARSEQAQPADDKDSAHGPDAGVSYWEVTCRIRPLILLMGLFALQSGVLTPSIIYISTSFFAGTDSNCGLDPTSQVCKRGAAELAYWKGILKGVSISVSWISALAFGSISDRIGRRPFYRIKAVLSALPVAMLALYEFSGVSLWIFLVIETFTDSVEIGGVFVATAADLVPEPHLRAAAFASLLASLLVIRGVVLAISLVPSRVAIMIAIAATGAVILYVEAFFTETGKHMADSGDSRCARLWSQVRQAGCVLFRNSVVFRTAVLIATSWFALSGVRSMVVPISTGYLGVTKRESIGLAFVTGFSMFLGAASTKPLVRCCGDLRALRFSLMAAVLYPIGIAASPSKWFFAFVTFALSAPMVVMLPVVGAMKSNLFAQEEQGLVQGALTSIRVVSSALAEFFCGWLYRHATETGTAPHSAVWGPFCTVAALFGVALIIALGLPAKLPVHPPATPPAKSPSHSSASPTTSSHNDDAEAGVKGS